MPKATAVEKGRGIEQTLGDLGIDMEADPEEAAKDAAAATSVVVEEVDDEELGGEGDGKDDEDEDEKPPAPAAKVVIPPPVALPMPGEDEDDDEADYEPPLVPPPKPGRPAPRKAPPGAGKLPKGLAEKAPGAAKVKVNKRQDGQRWFINEYTMDDLKTFPDFESFLTRYVKPKYGPGEYDLVGVDQQNREIELGTVRLLDEPNKKEGNAAMDLVTQMLQQNKERDEEWLSRMKETMTPTQQVDPIAMLQGVMNVSKELSGGADEAKAEAAAQAASSSDKTMQMMMMMMQQNQAAADRQNQMMMSLLAKPKEEDPLMKMLLLKMTEEGGITGGGGAPPPPPKPPSKTEGLSEILTAMAAFMGSMGGGGGGEDDDFKDFLKAMLLQKQGDGLSTKEAIQLLMQKDEKPGTDDFRKSIDNMAAIMNVAQNMNKGQEGGPAAGLFDALAALFSNRDFAGSIANTIRAKTDQSGTMQQTQLAAERQRLELERRMAVRTQQLHAGQVPGQPVQQPPQPQHVQQPGPGPQPQQHPQQPGQPQGGPPNQQPQLTTHQVQQAAERTIARTGKLPQLPANTHEHINSLATAKDEGELVGRTVQMLIYFAEFDDWRDFTEQLLGAVRNGNKGMAIEYLSAFFEGLAAIHLIDPTLAKTTVKAVHDHFGDIKAHLAELPLDGDEVITGEDLIGDIGDVLGDGDDGDDDGEEGEDPDDSTEE
jgi:hypothetical protein